MNNVFSFFAKAGTYIIWLLVLAGFLQLIVLGKVMYKKLLDDHSEAFSKGVSITFCVLVGGFALISLVCVAISHRGNVI